MTAYPRVAELDRRMRAGGFSLPEFAHIWRTERLGALTGFTPEQLKAACKVNEPPEPLVEVDRYEPDPEKPKRESVKKRRRSRS